MCSRRRCEPASQCLVQGQSEQSDRTAGADRSTREVISTSVTTANATTTGSNIDQVASVSGKDVVLLAGRDLQANAVVIAASGEATLSAGRDVRLGAGGSKIPRAVGVGPTDPTVVAKDATNMPNIPSGSQAKVVANNPYIPKSAGGTFSMMDYLPEAARVTQPGGEIVINRRLQVFLVLNWGEGHIRLSYLIRLPDS